MNRTRTRLLLSTLVIAALAAIPTTSDAQTSDTTQTKSLYDRLGGLAPIAVVVSDFVDLLEVDSVLNKNPAIDAARKRTPGPYLKYHVTALVCQVTGGPCQYGGRGMKESHAHMNISEADWARMAELLRGVLAKHKVPDKEVSEVMAIVESTKKDIVKPN